MNQKVKKGIKIAVDVFLWIFLIFALLMTILAFTAQASSTGVPELGGKCFLTVLTPSMEGPEGFYVGDLIIGQTLTDAEKKTLEVGQVITFLADLPDDGVDGKVLNSHRIVEVRDNGNGSALYYTKGDHNTYQDANPVMWDDVQAVWTGTRLPGLGSAISFLQSSTGFLVCVVIPLLLFFAYEVYVLIATILKIRNRGKRQITKEDEELIKQKAIEEYLRQQAEAAKASSADTSALAETNDAAGDENHKE